MTTRPGYLNPTGHEVGWNPPRGHAIGCVIDGGHRRHGARGFTCLKCAASMDATVEVLLTKLDRRAPAWM